MANAISTWTLRQKKKWFEASPQELGQEIECLAEDIQFKDLAEFKKELSIHCISSFNFEIHTEIHNDLEILAYIRTKKVENKNNVYCFAVDAIWCVFCELVNPERCSQLSYSRGKHGKPNRDILMKHYKTSHPDVHALATKLFDSIHKVNLSFVSKM